MDAAPWRRRRWQAAMVGAFLPVCLFAAYWVRSSPRTETVKAPPPDAPVAQDLGRPSDLPLPGGLPVARYEEKLFEFLNARQYQTLAWPRDKGVRDTGPYIDGKYYGTHPAVRVFYSPGVIRWLEGGRVGRIPDGEMIVKEQYAAPAIRHQGKTEEELWDSLESWSVMVKDSSASHDGWFWSNPAKGQCVTDGRQYPFDYPTSGFGLYCIRCHASTQSPGVEPASDANEFTFASLRNVAGFPGEPIQFRVDDSWAKDAGKKKPSDAPSGGSHPKCTRPKPPERPAVAVNPRFLSFFGAVKPVGLEEVVRLPPATHDRVVSPAGTSLSLVTSGQCMNCHAGLLAPFGPSMFVPTGDGKEYGSPGWNVSPFGEWRWTPMGLAGRDPVFYAQLESEIASIRKDFRSDPTSAQALCATLTDACLRCHGAMGKNQFDADHAGASERLSLDQVFAVGDPTQREGQGDAKYGALARDGVSCLICHRMKPREQPPDDHRPYLQYFLESSITGHFQLGMPGEVYGPYPDDAVAPYAMEHATGMKPKHGDFLKSSQLCGTCHTVSLPAIDKPPGGPVDELARCEIVPQFRGFHHHVEQATYLEWLNSEYENEINRQNPLAKTCQDCHMSRGLKDVKHGVDIAQIRTRIAAVQDTTYPEAENLAPADQLRVGVRYDGFRRHNFSGLNAFLLEMFDQFDDVLGVPRTDYMTGSTQDLNHAADNFGKTARDDVATVEVEAGRRGPNGLTARVVVRNKVGHRFPSGVGFRRAFLELSVVQKAEVQGGAESVLWASGRTDELGVIVGGDGQPLPTESFARDPDTGLQRYQKHHVEITSQDQVQIYETLLRNAKGEFTTSFIRGCETAKDNRLLPRGWRREGPGPALTGAFLESTRPDAETAKAPGYADGRGGDEVTYRVELPGNADPARLQVRAALYYQAIPPYFLRNLFETAPDGPATRRLHYLCSRLDLKGTLVEGWKLRIASAACDVK